MASSLLEALYQNILGNAGISAAVDGQIFKNLALEESGTELRSSNQTLISCELVGIDGTRYNTDLAFIVDVRSKKSYEYTSEIVQLLKDLLDDGFPIDPELGPNVLVTKIEAPILVSPELVGWRSRMKIFGEINDFPSISSLTPNLASPRAENTEIVFTCVAADTELNKLEYRFLLTGPGIGNVERDLTGWTTKNSFVWKTTHIDIGANTVKAEVREEPKLSGRGAYDYQPVMSITKSYTITAESAGSAPTITSLTPNLASPQALGREITFVCIAADADNDEILCKFLLNGPGTGSKLQAVTNWQKGNSWVWKPGLEDVGASTVYVQIRDDHHAGPGSYDAQTSASYTISSGSAPTITSLTPNLASPQVLGKEITFVCIAADADNDEILYKFLLNGPGTGSKLQAVTNWQKGNSWTWKPAFEDVGASTVYVQIRDDHHAGPGSYDAQTSASFTVSESLPTITSLTTYPASPQVPTTEIRVICVASDANNEQILYRFLVTGPGTGSKYIDLTGWQAKNWTTWTPRYIDSGSNTLKAQIIDQKHASKGGYDAETALAFTVSP